MAAAASLVLRAREDRDATTAEPFHIAPLSDGGIQVEWRSLRGALEVDISPRSELGFLLVRGTGDSRTFEEEEGVTPDRVVGLLEWLLSSNE
jgi:hypothetical protein